MADQGGTRAEQTAFERVYYDNKWSKVPHQDACFAAWQACAREIVRMLRERAEVAVTKIEVSNRKGHREHAGALTLVLRELKGDIAEIERTHGLTPEQEGK
jgi:hypothetical protein